MHSNGIDNAKLPFFFKEQSSIVSRFIGIFIFIFYIVADGNFLVECFALNLFGHLGGFWSHCELREC